MGCLTLPANWLKLRVHTVTLLQTATRRPCCSQTEPAAHLGGVKKRIHPLGSHRRFRALVDPTCEPAAGRDLCETLIDIPRVAHQISENIRHTIFSEDLCELPGRSITRDLVVSDSLRICDQRCVNDVRIAILAHRFTCLPDKPAHRFARHALWFHIQVRASMLQPAEVGIHLLGDVREFLAQLLVRCAAEHGGQHGAVLSLGVVEIARLLDEQVLERVEGGCR